MSIVLDYALRHGIITKAQHARAARIDTNRQLGRRKAGLTRRRKELSQRLFRRELTREEYLAGVAAVDAELDKLNQ